MKDFYQLFLHELKDINHAEQQLLKALPEMAHAATNAKLKAAFEDHLEETRGQVERLEMISQELKENLSGSVCEAMLGLIKEAHRTLQMGFPEDVKDAALISAAQRIEHYEIAVYGTLVTYAEHLKYETVYQLLWETLKEEKAADKKLSTMAEGTLFTTGINKKALNHSTAKR